MMKVRLTTIAVLVALLGAFALAPFGAAAAPAKSRSDLRSIPVHGKASNGRNFTGRLTVTNLSYDATKGLLLRGVVEGKLVGKGRPTQVSQTAFEAVEATVSDATGALSSDALRTRATCQILRLQTGRITLNVLGLVVDIAPLDIVINAVSGPGNLLGNLLCAVANLLNPQTGLLNLISNLTQLTDLLTQINRLLA